MEGLPEWFIQNLTAEELVEARCRPIEPVSSAFVSSVSSIWPINKIFWNRTQWHDFDETLAKIWLPFPWRFGFPALNSATWNRLEFGPPSCQARREKLQHLELWKKLNAGQLYQVDGHAEWTRYRRCIPWYVSDTSFETSFWHIRVSKHIID